MPDDAGLADPSASAPTDRAADVEPTATDVDARAAKMLRDAERAAIARGRAMVDEARAVRRRMLDDLETRRRALYEDVQRLRGALDDLAAELTEPVQVREGADPDEEAAPAAVAETQRVAAPTADAAFARLREEKSEAPLPPAADASTPPEAPAPPEEPPPAAREPEPEAELEPPRPPSDPDDAIRRRRDEMLAPLIVPLLRASKRLLQDEQNDLLDTVRRLRGRVEASRLLTDPEKQAASWSAILEPTVAEAYAVGRALTGRGRRPTSAPRRLVGELASGLVAPLRERLITTIDGVAADGPYESSAELHAALLPAISARYREWRSDDLEGLLGDLLAAAYARGAFDATPSGATLRWVPAEVGQCPDADDNALEPTIKGQGFPTGQPYPPAHPGCRCLVVPSDAGGPQGPG